MPNSDNKKLSHDPRNTHSTKSGQLSQEDWVVIAIVIIGFIGCVVLLQMKIAPVVVAFFLATGVAAAVYRFLGGISGASFTVGALKVTGTIAILIFLAMFIDKKLAVQLAPPAPTYTPRNPLSEYTISDMILGGDRVFAWQWAGENWIGQFEFDNATSNEIPITDFFMDKVIKEEGRLSRTTIMKLANPGKFTIRGNVLEMELDVQKGGTTEKLISKNLQLIPAFYGTVRFGKKGTGNIILTKCRVF